MNSNLANLPLRDIHLPEAVSWWPPAIGWWIVLGLIILAVWLLPKLYRYLKFKPLNKVSTTAYQNIINEYQQHKDNKQLVQSLSKLLRQISMSYQGRESSAHLTGNEWVNKLNTLTKEDYFGPDVRQLLIEAPYQEKITTIPKALVLATKNLIAALPKKNVGLKK